MFFSIFQGCLVATFLWLSPLGLMAFQEPSPSVPEPPQSIELLHDYDEAIRLSELHKRPLLVILGATWCGPCKKMEQDLKTDDAQSIFQKWIVVKIDVDEQPALAQELDAGSIPALRVLGHEQAVMASTEGYSSLAETKNWLEENLLMADPKTQGILASKESPDEAALTILMTLLGDRRHQTRRIAMDRLAKFPKLSGEKLVQLLRDGSLAQKLSTVEIFRQWKAPVEELDPWVPETIEESKLVILSDWLSKLE